MTLGCILRLVEVFTCQLDMRPERSHAVDFQRVGGARGENGEGAAALAACVGHALAEVAGGGADDRARIVSQGVHEVIGAAAFEGADGVDGFDLEERGHAKAFAHWLADELRGMEEDGVDHICGFVDAAGGDGAVHEGRIGGGVD